MALVVDCTIVANAVLDQPLTRHAHRVLASGHTLHAPVLLASELANALWLQVRAGGITPHEANERLDAVEASGIEFVDDDAVRQGALAMACAHGHPVYDCEYIALAVALGAEFVTADRRQLLLARELLGECAVWLGEFGSAERP